MLIIYAYMLASTSSKLSKHIQVEEARNIVAVENFLRAARPVTFSSCLRCRPIYRVSCG